MSWFTTREFDCIEGALQNMQRRLGKVLREARPDAYVRTRESEHTALGAEIDKLQITRARLVKLHGKRASKSDVYGSAADHPEFLTENLPRWKAHPENTVEEQLAMSPPPLEDPEAVIAAITGGHAVGMPYHLDIDSIT